MSEYSITDERDENGELKEVDHTYIFDGKERTVRLVPPTISQVEELEKMEQKDDPSVSELMDVFGEYIVKPKIDNPTMKEANSMAEAILDYVSGGTELAEAAEKELEKRGGSGN